MSAFLKTVPKQDRPGFVDSNVRFSGPRKTSLLSSEFTLSAHFQHCPQRFFSAPFLQFHYGKTLHQVGAVRRMRTSLCKDNEAALYAAPS